MAAAYENFFPAVWARLLRMGQGMNPLNRKASGGHVEYEICKRWLDAFGLSLNLAGMRDVLSETILQAPPSTTTMQGRALPTSWLHCCIPCLFIP